MGSGASSGVQIISESASPIISRSVEVIERFPRSKNIDKFHADAKTVKKKQGSFMALKFRPNAKLFHSTEPEAPPTTPKESYAGVVTIDYYDITGCNTSTSFGSPSPCTIGNSNFDFSPQAFIQNSSYLQFKNNNAYLLDECSLNFAYALSQKLTNVNIELEYKDNREGKVVARV